MSFVSSIIAKIRREPVLVTGVVLSAVEAVSQAVSSSASWKAAIPALVGWALRQHVAPVVSASKSVEVGPVRFAGAISATATDASPDGTAPAAPAA